MEYCRFFPNCHRGEKCPNLHLNRKEFPCLFAKECNFGNQCEFSHSLRINNNTSTTLEQRLFFLQNGYKLDIFFQETSGTVAVNRLLHLSPQYWKFVSPLLFFFKNYTNNLMNKFHCYIDNILTILTDSKLTAFQDCKTIDCFESSIIPLLGLLSTPEFNLAITTNNCKLEKSELYHKLASLKSNFKQSYFDAMLSITNNGFTNTQSIKEFGKCYTPMVYSELFYPIFFTLFHILNNHQPLFSDTEWCAIFDQYIHLFQSAMTNSVFDPLEQSIIHQIQDIINSYQQQVQVSSHDLCDAPVEFVRFKDTVEIISNELNQFDRSKDATALFLSNYNMAKQSFLMAYRQYYK